MAFQGVDFLEIDSLLSEDEKVVRAAVRQWVEENVKPIIEKHAQAGTFPLELFQPQPYSAFAATPPARDDCLAPLRQFAQEIRHRLLLFFRQRLKVVVDEEGAR